MHGCFLFSSSDDLLLRMWNLVDPSDPYELGVLRPPVASVSYPSSSGSDSPIICLDVIQPSGLILSAAVDGTLLVWDYSTFEDERAFKAYGKIVFRAKYVDHNEVLYQLRFCLLSLHVQSRRAHSVHSLLASGARRHLRHHRRQTAGLYVAATGEVLHTAFPLTTCAVQS